MHKLICFNLRKVVHGGSMAEASCKNRYLKLDRRWTLTRYKEENFPVNDTHTETLYTVVTQNIFNEHALGKIYTWDVKVTLMGLQKEAVSKRIVEIYDLPLTWQEYADLAQAQIEVLMKNCRLMPGMCWIFDKILLIRIFFFLFFLFFLF